MDLRPLQPLHIVYFTFLLFLNADSSSPAPAFSLTITALTNLLLLPISQGSRAHRTKTIELINLNVLGTRRLICHRRRWIHQLLTWLTRLAYWLAALLRRKCPLVDVELLLPPDVDLILLRGGKHVI